MARLSICLLGSFQVTLDGDPVTNFESDKVRALLAYLCVEAKTPQRREKLAGLLWPERPESAARANLRHALANLRLVIGDRQAKSPFLITTWQTIQFNNASDFWVDVAAFTALAQTSQSPTRGTIERMENALELYRGSFLEGFSLPDSPAFEEWALLEGERLQRLAKENLRFLSAWYERCGEFELALDHAWRHVALDPWQENAQQQLLRLLAYSGQREAALVQYQTYRRCLAEELGVEPSTKMVALYDRILDGSDQLTPQKKQRAT